MCVYISVYTNFLSSYTIPCSVSRGVGDAAGKQEGKHAHTHTLSLSLLSPFSRALSLYIYQFPTHLAALSPLPSLPTTVVIILHTNPQATHEQTGGPSRLPSPAAAGRGSLYGQQPLLLPQ